MKKEDFLKYYTNTSNVELLKILDQKEHYQFEAIEAINEILSSRNYSSEELEIAQSEIMEALNKKKEQKKKIEHIKNKANDLIDEHLSFKEYSPEKTLNVFCVVLFFYSLITFLVRIKSPYFNDSNIFYIEILSYLLQFILIYLLYKRSNWGWVGLAFIFTFLSISGIISIVHFYYYKSEFSFLGGNPYPSLLSFLFCSSIVWFLNTKRVFSQLTIDKWGRIATLIVAAIVSFAVSFALSF